jgi:hypothetical protein
LPDDALVASLRDDPELPLGRVQACTDFLLLGGEQGADTRLGSKKAPSSAA